MSAGWFGEIICTPPCSPLPAGFPGRTKENKASRTRAAVSRLGGEGPADGGCSSPLAPGGLGPACGGWEGPGLPLNPRDSQAEPPGLGLPWGGGGVLRKGEPPPPAPCVSPQSEGASSSSSSECAIPHTRPPSSPLRSPHFDGDNIPLPLVNFRARGSCNSCLRVPPGGG